MSDLPDWIEDRIEFDGSRALQERDVVKIFLESERPFLVRRQVENQLEDPPTKNTVLARLEDLCGAEVLKNDSPTGVYWLNNEDSAWPIPNDVAVEPVSDEMTKSEFLNQEWVQYGLYGMLSLVVSNLLLWIGAFISEIGFSIFGYGGNSVIFVSLFGILLGLVFVSIAGYMKIRQVTGSN